MPFRVFIVHNDSKDFVMNNAFKVSGDKLLD